MKNVRITNLSDIEIPIDEWLRQLRPHYKRIPEEAFPLLIIFKDAKFDEKKGYHERSHYSIQDKKIVVNIDPEKNLDKIKWSFMHEFRHFMQLHIEELFAATFGDNDVEDLKTFVNKIHELDDDAFYDTFHDMLPFETDAIVFATEMTGKNFRKHKLRDGIKRYINKERTL
jgi:hypothetical protein